MSIAPGEGTRATAQELRRLLEARAAVHMVGIAGVGMAGLAIQLRERGFRVTGCDESDNSLAVWLRDRGIAVESGHDPGHLTGAEWVIRTPAVPPGDPELLAAADMKLPVFNRGVVLPEMLRGRRSVAVSGTHGKTTTTAMIVQVLRGAGIDASFCVGAEVPSLGGVAGAGRDDAMVVEADESDGTVAFYDSDYAVITNIDLDHVDFFPGLPEMRACFRSFAARARKALIGCIDDPETAGLLRAGGARGIGYGFAEGADIRGDRIETGAGSSCCRVSFRGKELGLLTLPVTGRHNLLNALGAVAVGLDWGIPFGAIAKALAGFGPARRRFEVVVTGRGITVVSDYAHHPAEIEALMQQAASVPRERIIAVFQPHRYTRTRAMGDRFAPSFRGCSEVYLAPVYAASERLVPGGRSADVFPFFERETEYRAHLCESLLDAWERIRKIWRAGDLVLVVGAGDVDKIGVWAKAELERITG